MNGSSEILNVFSLPPASKNCNDGTVGFNLALLCLTFRKRVTNLHSYPSRSLQPQRKICLEESQRSV